MKYSSLRVVVLLMAVVVLPVAMLAAEGAAVRNEDKTPHGYDYFTVRDGLNNCRLTFEKQKKARVVFLGGSITAGAGWRDLVSADLKKRFPGTAFDFVNTGVGGTGSKYHAFRFVRDVLAKGPVDLLFVEAAVNDQGQPAVTSRRGMEGVIRQARLANPMLDIIMLQFVDPPKIKEFTEGKVPEVIQQHEKVAEHYGVASIDLAKEVSERIKAGEFTWAKDFKNLHPSPFGHALYARGIARLFDAAWKQPLPADAKLTAHKLPEKPLDERSFFNAKLVDIKEAKPDENWTVVPNWKPSMGSPRAGFSNIPVLSAEKAGATLKLKFAGTAVGVLAVAGPDAGSIEYSIDGGAMITFDPFHPKFSPGMNLGAIEVFNAELAPGAHELVLKVGAKSHPASKGTAVRITHFMVN